MERIAVKYNDLPIYDIVLEQEYNGLLTELDELDSKNRKVCIVTDSKVSNFYLNEVANLLENHVKTVKTFVFPFGESSKSLDTVYTLYEYLIKETFDRKDILVALGGGVVGDLTGYAAATYLRGISFIQVPTTLLSMVDSSIGGKTGVDFMAYKNMVGAFHQPKLVYMNLNSLKTLDSKEFYAGFGEIIKHGLIKDATYYNWLKDNVEEIRTRDISTMNELVSKSCFIKREVVEKDPKEVGERALLNFGHTIGHAIEKLKEFKLMHGECVAIGMVAASYLSYLKHFLTLEEVQDIEKTISEFHLPTFVTGLRSEDILNITKSDKKVESGTLKFILLSKIGNATMDTTITDELLLDAINYVIR